MYFDLVHKDKEMSNFLGCAGWRSGCRQCLDDLRFKMLQFLFQVENTLKLGCDESL